MSLKLGNTNIAGTQILYSTTGNNTDGAMTQALTTTELNNCVHLSGTETIIGDKTFNNSVYVKNTKYAYNETPSSSSFTSLYIRDKNNVIMGACEFCKATNGYNHMRLNVFGQNGYWAAGALGLGVAPSGETYTYCPASDVNGSIVTTVNKSKNTNGYFQLGNGLIINWGRTSNTQQTNVTFSKAYSNANSYAVIAVPYTSSNSNQDGYSCYVTNLSSTGCTIWNKMYGSSISAIKHWIAVGY